LVDKQGNKHHEKKLGQLFCDDSAQQIIDMLLNECEDAGVEIFMDTSIVNIESGFTLNTTKGIKTCSSLIIATGGLSIPKIGASRFGYDVAEKFGHTVTSLHAALVPLTFTDDLLERCKELTGLSVEASVSHGKTSFAEGFLFTHRGISGPSILQISSYWREGDEITVNLAPGIDAFKHLKNKKANNPKQEIATGLCDLVPKRLADSLCADAGITGRLADTPDKKLEALGVAVNAWRVKPAGSEGYRTAEVTLGGVDTTEISSKTMESAKHPGLYFIGEVMDVTGHLGGFNFQWAWSSGYVAGLSV
jgi:predicted Rossmann fold flavoprotein